MIRILVYAWLIPMALIILVMFFFMQGKTRAQISRYLLLSEEKAAQICKSNLDSALADSRNASYNNTIQESYDTYRAGGTGRALYREVTGFLKKQYGRNASFYTTMLLFTDDPDIVYYAKHDTGVKDPYRRVRDFTEHAKEEVLRMSKRIDTAVAFTNIGGRCYLVRNMVRRDFKPFAVLVMELNPSVVFGSLSEMAGYMNYGVYEDGVRLAGTDEAETDRLYADFGKRGRTEAPVYRTGSRYYTHTAVTIENHNLELLVRVDMGQMRAEQYAVLFVFLAQLLLLVPLLILILAFFKREVTVPVETLAAAASRIEKGDLGSIVPNVGNSREADVLAEGMNRMSKELKRQFDTIYSEEIALRDARIRTLQSQINPHFLNNTLEIINWEARMAGDINVSTMIEALSTMLFATMNREKKRYAPLSEEVDYMNAYLLIAKKRFGKKLVIETDIDEELLPVEVPRLIVEPIVENAIEHGRDSENNIRVHIAIRARSEDIVITVRNRGNLSAEDTARITRLLDVRQEAAKEAETAVSIGIRNVNLRLKMIYGKESGLTITDDEEGYTTSMLVLRRNLPKPEQPGA